MAENASQSIKNPWASRGLEWPPDPRPLVPSTYGAQWPFSVLAPVKFMAGCLPVHRKIHDELYLTKLTKMGSAISEHQVYCADHAGMSYLLYYTKQSPNPHPTLP